jgi:plastocyanin
MQRPPALVAALLAAAVLGTAGCAAAERPAGRSVAVLAAPAGGHQHDGSAAGAAPVAPSGGVLAMRIDKLEPNAVEFQWKPGSLLLQPRRTVTLRITNNDYMQHNFTFKAAKVTANLPVGKTTTIKLTAPASGTYRFYCKYHLQMMEGTVTVP